jgi:hypothetical protein
MDLYLDTETLPTADERVIAKIAAGIKPPASMKKAETIAAWEANERHAALAEAIAKTSLDGAYGRIGVIGFAINDFDPVGYTAVDSDEGDGLSNDFDEKTLIADFFRDVELSPQADRLHDLKKFSDPIRIVGHNVVSFDIRVITQRAIILGVKMPWWWPINPKPWDACVFDTMTAWAGVRDYVSLDKLCMALGLDGKGEIDGSMVADLWAKGEIAKVRHYCRDDVRKVRAVAQKMWASLPDRRAA